MLPLQTETQYVCQCMMLTLGVDEISGDAMIAGPCSTRCCGMVMTKNVQTIPQLFVCYAEDILFLVSNSTKYSHILSLFESLSLTLRKPLSPHPDLLNCEHGDFCIIMSIITYFPEKLESSGRIWLLEFSGTAQMRRITLVSSLHP